MNVKRVAITMACCMTISLGALANDETAAPESHRGIGLTPLDRYVHAPDPHYRYELIKRIEGDGYTGYIIDMTSQKWLTEEEVDRPLWQHWVHIVRPHEVKSDTGLLFIGGGNNLREAPENVSGRLIGLATMTNTVVAQLDMVPNQPLTFAGDGRPRSEDSAIAYTWHQFMTTGDERWPMRLPMTKSAVRAMDTITSFCASGEGGMVDVSKFVVAGGSKRGWTTWTTAAVDNRVVAIAPIVIDLLNVVPSFIHHFEVYGRYAPAVRDYENMNIMAWTGSAEYQRLLEIVEPYEYRKRLTLPKYLINSTGDQFFIPDSSQFYWDDLEGDKYLRYVPNGDHGLGGTDASDNLLSWYHSIVHNVPRPRYTWTIAEDGAIHAFTLDEPMEVRLWQATNPESRNFMKDVIGDAYTSTVLSPDIDGIYVGKPETPETGWTAFFIEFTYPSGTVPPFKFTTEVKVLPEDKPYTYEYPKPGDRDPGFLSN